MCECLYVKTHGMKWGIGGCNLHGRDLWLLLGNGVGHDDC